MEGLPLGEFTGAVGLVVAVVAFLWEFALAGRKRLGYRFQMDTAVTGAVALPAGYAGVLDQLQPPVAGQERSMVLLRVENDGSTAISESDYRVPGEVTAGLRVRFPRRRVIGLAVTEMSDPDLGRSLGDTSTGAANTGIQVHEDPAHQTGLVDLPKVPLNRADYYKVLVVLERWENGTSPSPDPLVDGRLLSGAVHETEAHTRPTRLTLALVIFLVVVIGIQLAALTLRRDGTPLDCARGTLALAGSTAFAPVLEQAAHEYQKACPQATFSFDFRGSAEGLRVLDQVGKQDNRPVENLLAFSDTVKPEGYPQLLPRPIALSLFSVVAHPKTGVEDLSSAALRDLFDGTITNWKQLGGQDLPVIIVGRPLGSGSREIMQQRLLANKWAPAPNSRNCRKLDDPAASGPVRCEVPATSDVLRTVAGTAGALGYSEAGAAAKHQGVTLVRIDGHKAATTDAVNGAYPFWSTVHAYTHREPSASSLPASFLRYLTDQVGKDIIRSFGDLPCAELANPIRCQPGR